MNVHDYNRMLQAQEVMSELEKLGYKVEALNGFYLYRDGREMHRSDQLEDLLAWARGYELGRKDTQTIASWSDRYDDMSPDRMPLGRFVIIHKSRVGFASPYRCQEWIGKQRHGEYQIAIMYFYQDGKPTWSWTARAKDAKLRKKVGDTEYATYEDAQASLQANYSDPSEYGIAAIEFDATPYDNQFRSRKRTQDGEED